MLTYLTVCLCVCLSVFLFVFKSYLVVCPCYYISWSHTLVLFLTLLLVYLLFVLFLICLSDYFTVSCFLFVFVFQHLLLSLFLFYVGGFFVCVFTYFEVTNVSTYVSNYCFSILLCQFLILSAYVFVN